MNNNYASLKSPLDEEDELKTDHEIDLEKGLLPEYNSEEEGALPTYSECPGALIRTRNSIRNGIAFFLGGIGNAMMGLANAIRGANDNNDIPLGEMDVESEV
ncbi:Wtf27 [Schizosaccharomyces pombe]